MVWLLAGMVLSAGCTTSAALAPPANALATSAPPLVEPAEPVMPIPVVRYGRYTLVELGANASQRDLLQQVIDIVLPDIANPTVGDAMHYVLLRSGYQPCASDVEAAPLYALPLPAADLHLGPMTLRDALQTLAGPAWRLQVDETTRRVCFTATAAHPAMPALPASDAAATTDPVPYALPAMETAP